MDLSKGVGSLKCRMCSASYEMPIHHLHEPVDVFSEWLDDCEAAERGEVAAASSAPRRGAGGDMSRVVHDTGRDYDDDDDDEEDDLPEASGLGQKMKSSSLEGEGQKSVGKTTVSSMGLDDSDDSDDDSD
jgi:transcription elongation factor Elf1